MAAIDKSTDATKRICWGRGDSDPKVFTIKTAAGVVQDISGQTFVLSVDSLLDPPSGGVTLLFGPLTGTFVSDGTDGKIQFAPTTTDTDIAAGEYFYDLQRSTPSIKTLIKGIAEIVMDITK